MNKIYHTILCLSLCTSLTGCIDEFLDKPAHNMTPELELNNIVNMSNAIYQSFVGLNESAGDAIYSMGEIASDNALRGSIFSDGGGTEVQKLYNQFQNFSGLSAASTIYIPAVWSGLYPGIDEANINLRAFDRLFPNADMGLKTALSAENRFARAWFYLFLVNTYGQIVMLPEEEVTPKEYAELTNDHSVSDVYDYIIKDLRYAAEHLPSKTEWAELYQLPWQGRAHNGSGKGYLAKALLYQAANAIYYDKANGKEKARKCYQEIVEIVSNLEGQYTLGDYEQIFRPEGNYNSESMFEIGTASTSEGTTRFAGWRAIQPRNYTGYGRLAPSLNLINQYERDPLTHEIIDKRHRGTVLYGETTPLSGMTHPASTDFCRQINGDVIDGVKFTNAVLAAGWPNRFCRKATQSKPTPTTTTPTTNLGGSNLKFLRWGEVLLIGAEAACYVNDEANARKWLKEVRQRAGLNTEVIDNMNGQALLEQVWKDKRLEIALEWSNRYFELVRIDKLNPGYMKACMEAKVTDEFAGIGRHLDETKGWSSINSPKFPITKDNYRELIPLRNELQLPKHYTMPISSTVFSTMTRVKQTVYYQ